MEDIVSTDSILRSGKGKNVEGVNGGRPSMDLMGMYLVEERSGIWKSHRDLPEV